jgi:hypothetical protein
MPPARSPLTAFRLLREGWMDLLSAFAFLVVWLLRDRFEYDTLRALLFWPVVFELYVALALFLAGMLATLRSDALRLVWFTTLGAGCLGAAWLTGEAAGQPQVWTIAAWLLAARLAPPRGLRFGGEAHRAWIWEGAGYTGLLWGAGFVATMLLMLALPIPLPPGADGVARSSAPAWIFPAVWTPYFLAEAALRAWRQPPR